MHTHKHTSHENYYVMLSIPVHVLPSPVDPVLQTHM